ncbi:BnaC05g01180D [Brassica napus]|uniref:BnaC05g01180D protein n=1 Tax=Brassica napus TaxID=3708 RepID=A0A078FQU2_BRANA|nr:BnaC05g01180D [Brassica napus]
MSGNKVSIFQGLFLFFYPLLITAYIKHTTYHLTL